MALEQTQDDSSHYEVSLTAGQAFIAFVLLLFSLAASFAFGVVIGKERNSEPLLAQNRASVGSEGRSREGSPQIAEPRAGDDSAPRIIEEPPPATEPELVEQAAERAGADTKAPAPVRDESPQVPEPVSKQPVETAGPWYAQLLSTSDVKSAEALAARLIDNGYTSAYVQRNAGEQGNIFRVRVRFPDEGAARAAATPLKAFSKGDVWITRQ